jgi:hypothetical protein
MGSVTSGQRREAQEKNVNGRQNPLICRGVCFIIGRQISQFVGSQANIRKPKEEQSVVKVNQEKLQEKIKKLKKTATEVIAKSEGKIDTAEVRKARKKVKRAQRKLRSAKAYKSGGAKAGEAKPAEAKASV